MRFEVSLRGRPCGSADLHGLELWNWLAERGMHRKVSTWGCSRWSYSAALNVPHLLVTLILNVTSLEEHSFSSKMLGFIGSMSRPRLLGLKYYLLDGHPNVNVMRQSGTSSRRRESRTLSQANQFRKSSQEGTYKEGTQGQQANMPLHNSISGGSFCSSITTQLPPLLTCLSAHPHCRAMHRSESLSARPV